MKKLKSLKSTPAPAPVAAVKEKKAAAPIPVTPAVPATKKAPSVNIGVRHGLRVMAFQDRTFAENDAKVRPTLGGPGFRTDAELAAEWNAEYPHSRAVQAGRITADMVQSVRNLFNNGTGGHGAPGARHASRAYVVNGTTRTPAITSPRGAKAPAAATSAPAPVPTTGPSKAKAKIVPAKKKSAAA